MTACERVDLPAPFLPRMTRFSPSFKEKDRTLAIETEKFESSLSKDQNDNFDSVMKLHYQIDSYYFALAYFLGKKHSEHFF